MGESQPKPMCMGGASKAKSISDNVSAVHEAPELTARSAEGFPRPSRATPFIGCVAGARKRAVRDTQPVR
jgi:hypothetical protein